MLGKLGFLWDGKIGGFLIWNFLNFGSFFAETRPLYLRAIQNFGFDAQVYSSTDGNLDGVEREQKIASFILVIDSTKHIANIQFLFCCIFNELELESLV